MKGKTVECNGPKVQSLALRPPWEVTLAELSSHPPPEHGASPGAQDQGHLVTGSLGGLNTVTSCGNTVVPTTCWSPHSQSLQERLPLANRTPCESCPTRLSLCHSGHTASSCHPCSSPSTSPGCTYLPTLRCSPYSCRVPPRARTTARSLGCAPRFQVAAQGGEKQL